MKTSDSFKMCFMSAWFLGFKIHYFRLDKPRNGKKFCVEISHPLLGLNLKHCCYNQSNAVSFVNGVVCCVANSELIKNIAGL